MSNRIINGKEYVETSEAVKIAGLSESHLRLLARKSQTESDKMFGKLPCIKVFGRWAYDKNALLQLAGENIENCEGETVENGLTESNSGEGGDLLDI